jgi:tetratricopeptide (TPR) repeat protein
MRFIDMSNNEGLLRRGSRFAALLAVAVVLVSTLGNNVTAQHPERDYYKASSYPDGIQMLRNLNQNHYRLAAGALERRRYQAAQADLEFMLKYFPNHPHALAGMAQVGIGLKRPDLADQHFRNAIERYPEHDETYMIYGVFLHRLGRTDAAIAQYKKALEINPNSGFGHYNLGLAYVDTKDYAQANAHAQKAYQRGVNLPGLKRRLEAARAWKPADPSADAGATPGPAKREGEAE